MFSDGWCHVSGPRDGASPRGLGFEPLDEDQSDVREVRNQILAELGRGKGERQALKSRRLPACQRRGSNPPKAKLCKWLSDRRRAAQSSGAAPAFALPGTVANRRTRRSTNRSASGG